QRDSRPKLMAIPRQREHRFDLGDTDMGEDQIPFGKGRGGAESVDLFAGPRAKHDVVFQDQHRRGSAALRLDERSVAQEARYFRWPQLTLDVSSTTAVDRREAAQRPTIAAVLSEAALQSRPALGRPVEVD